jgi:prepilin-type N-terminal cleavage/methylation domain-containing protein
MKFVPKRKARQRDRRSGFSLIELVIVVFVILVISAIVIPNAMLAVSNLRLRASGGGLAGLMQQARILAAKNNATYQIKYGVRNNAQIAFVDLNGNGVWDASVTVNGVTMSEPDMQFAGTVVPAAGAPSGAGGQPTPYVLVGDTGAGSYDNTSTLAYTPRGLPCKYLASPSPATCSTPAATYFVFYMTDTRIGAPGWAAVVVTKGGRSQVVSWNGTSWH